MGKRTIETVLRLQSESEYKAGLKSCGAELRVLKSDLERVTSEFRTNANSMEALTKKGAALSKIYETQQEKVALLRGALEKAQQTQTQEQQTIARLKTQYAQAKKVLSDYGAEVDKTSEDYQQSKAAVDQLRDAIISHQARLDSSSNAIRKYAVQLNRAEVELDRMGDQVAENDRLLDEARASADGCAVSMDRYGDRVQQAGRDTESATSAVDALAGALVAGGLHQAVETVAASLQEASKASQDYEHNIRQVTTIADASVMSQNDLSAGILRVSADVRRHADEVSEAAYEALSAGVQTQHVLDFTTRSAKLATAGFTDLGTSVDVLTTIENAYRMGAEHTEEISSKLVKTQDLGKITVDELGKVIGRVIPSAAAYSVNLDNVAAAYARMTAAGINAENTTTYVSAMLDELADSGSGAAGILREQTGRTFSELMEQGKDLGDVLQILSDSVEGDQVAFSNLWSSATAAKAAVALFDGSAASFHATLEDIAASSGTVERNYEKMAQASETSSKRLEVAQRNLQIQIGDQLNPVLDELRESGADLLENAGRAIQKNPALVSVLTGTVTALGALGTGLSGLMVAKSAAAAMKALNIALAANPATAAAVGIAALIGAVAGYATKTAAARAEVDALTAASQDLNQTVAEAQTAYEQAEAGADAASTTVQGYIERLRELESQGLRTQDSQLEYSMIVDKINQIMPGLNAQLDEQTGLLAGGTEALNAQAEAWAANAKQQAVLTRYQDDIAAMADAEYELAKNKALLKMAEKDHASALETKAAVIEQINEAEREYNTLSAQSCSATEEHTEQLKDLAGKSASLHREVDRLNGIIADNEQEQKNLGEAIQISSEAVETNRGQVDAASAAYAAFADQTAETAEQAGQNTQALADDTDLAMQQLQDAYWSARDAARESLDQQIGLFEDLSGECEMSTQDMIQALQNQQVAFTNYADNIQLALNRGIDAGLVQKLSDGSASSMKILAELVTATDDQIGELNKAFEGTEESKEIVSGVMSEVKTDILTTLEQMGVDIYAKGFDLGTYLARGLAAGVRAETPHYTKEVQKTADKGYRKYQEVNMIQSPSKRYQQLAEYDIQGLLVQYRAGVPKVQQATRDLADQGYLSSIRARQASIPSLPVAGSAAAGTASQNPRLYVMLQELLDAVRAGQSISIDGQSLIGATAQGYDETLGHRKTLKDRGAL